MFESESTTSLVPLEEGRGNSSGALQRHREGVYHHSLEKKTKKVPKNLPLGSFSHYKFHSISPQAHTKEGSNEQADNTDYSYNDSSAG